MFVLHPSDVAQPVAIFQRYYYFCYKPDWRVLKISWAFFFRYWRSYSLFSG